MSLSSWERVPISTVYLGLYDGPHATPSPAEEGPIFLGIKNFTEDGHLDLTDIRHISWEEYPRWIRRVEPQPGDIVFTYEATLHRYAIIPEGFKGCLGRRTALIRPNTDVIDTRFLFYYFFGSHWHEEVSRYLLSGSTVDRIPLTDFPAFEIWLPPLPIQQHIAAVLSAYDDLIENNRQRIAALEATAQALYREWFVEMRFPGWQAVEWVESELGVIPAGWEVLPLSELVDTQYGYTESAQVDPVGPKFVRGMDINKTSYIDWASVPYCPIDDDKYEKYRLSVGDIMVIRMADPGKVGIVEKEVEAVFASYLIRLLIKSEKLTPYYLFHFLSSDIYQGYITGASTGTTRKSASAGVVTGIDILIPPPETLAVFEEKVAIFRYLLTSLLDRSATLRETRNLLLPRLISGEVSVEELPLPESYPLHFR